MMASLPDAHQPFSQSPAAAQSAGRVSFLWNGIKINLNT